MAQDIQHLQVCPNAMNTNMEEEFVGTEETPPVGDIVMQDHSYSKSPFAEVITSFAPSPPKDRPQQLMSLIRDPEQLQALAAARQVDQKYFENIGKDASYASSTHPHIVDSIQKSSKVDKNDKMDSDGFTEVSLMLQSPDFQLPKDLRAELDDGEHTDPYAHEDLPQEPLLPQSETLQQDTNKRKRRVSLKLREDEFSPTEQPVSKKKLKKKKRRFSADGKKLTKEEKRVAKLAKIELKKLKRRRKQRLNNALKPVQPPEDITDDLNVIQAANGGNNLKSRSRHPRPVQNYQSDKEDITTSKFHKTKENLHRATTRRGRPVRTEIKSMNTSSNSLNNKVTSINKRPSILNRKRNIAGKDAITRRTRAAKTKKNLLSKNALSSQRTRADTKKVSIQKSKTPVETRDVKVVKKQISDDKPSLNKSERKFEVEGKNSWRPAGRTTRNSLSASELELQQALKASAAEAVVSPRGGTQKRLAASPASRRSLRSTGVKETQNSVQMELSPKRRKLRK